MPWNGISIKGCHDLTQGYNANCANGESSKVLLSHILLENVYSEIKSATLTYCYAQHGNNKRKTSLSFYKNLCKTFATFEIFQFLKTVQKVGSTPFPVFRHWFSAYGTFQKITKLLVKLLVIIKRFNRF